MLKMALLPNFSFLHSSLPLPLGSFRLKNLSLVWSLSLSYSSLPCLLSRWFCLCTISFPFWCLYSSLPFGLVQAPCWCLCCQSLSFVNHLAHHYLVFQKFPPGCDGGLWKKSVNFRIRQTRIGIPTPLFAVWVVSVSSISERVISLIA